MFCTEAIARIFLVVTNVAMCIIGFVVLGIGLVVKFRLKFVSLHVNALLTRLASKFAGVIDIDELIGGVTLGFIIIGSCVLLIGFLGCCGAWRKYRILLRAYALLIGLLILGEIVCFIGVFFLEGFFANEIKKVLAASMQKTYRGGENVTAIKGPWNYVFAELECCGVTSYTDLHNTTRWNRNVTVNGKARLLATPISCCTNITGRFPKYHLPDPTCAISPNDTTSNWKTGCYDRLKAVLQIQSKMFAIVVLIVAAIEITCVLAAYVVFRSGKSLVSS